ncbi:interleukin-7 receptor subunit alpha [Halichoeres trimaculatus]|uniref:interleukin-7 receptor subunit alpha n=1 Tax=Halichoeres trimaculatus TaxID=147232 RepID=UPI003D9E969B
MLCVWGVTVFLLLPARTGAQSGDSDSELRLGCTSHIMITSSSLTCRLVGGRSDNEDDEDEEADSIERITICYTDLDSMRRCIERPGNSISSPDLSPMVLYDVTAHLKSGSLSLTQMDLKRMIKPRSPKVLNVTFHSSSSQTMFLIQTPYHKEYLRVQNQLFQLHIWTEGHTTVQNVSSSDTLKVDTRQLKSNAQYHVRVRALPIQHLKGTWSEWSQTFIFVTPGGDAESELIRGEKKPDVQVYGLIACLVLLLVTSCAVFFWKKKAIFSYMWPAVPHPKGTLVQICKTNKGLLLNFRPEEFSALKVVPIEKPEDQQCDDVEFSRPATADSSDSSPPCSTQTTECSTTTTSVSTEELEMSALLGHSSSGRGDDEDGLQSPGPSSINVPQVEQGPHTPEGSSGEGLQPGVFGVNQQEEAYVTMSSFFQIRSIT